MQTRPLPETADARSPAGAEIRYLIGGTTGDMIHSTVPPGQVNRATVHVTVSEFWHVLSGQGEIWRRDESGEEVTVLTPGVSIDIPVGTAFQYRCTGAEALRFLCITMPPWPGDAEATRIEGPWVPTAPVGPVRMNVALRPLEDGDLDAIFQQVTDPESVRMAAFTAENQTDRRAFLDRMARLRADTSVSYRVVDVDGAVAGTIGSFRIDDQPEVTYWVDRTQWGKGIATAALRILLAETAERPLYARAASDNVGSLRVLEKAGFRRVGVNRDFAPGRGEEIEETILRLD